MTYTALATLVILRDDLTRVNKPGILEGLAKSQRSDGSFRASIEEDLSDMRFVYCAASICTILNDFSSIDADAMANYIINSLSYEGTFSQNLPKMGDFFAEFQQKMSDFSLQLVKFCRTPV